MRTPWEMVISCFFVSQLFVLLYAIVIRDPGKTSLRIRCGYRLGVVTNVGLHFFPEVLVDNVILDIARLGIGIYPDVY